MPARDGSIDQLRGSTTSCCAAIRDRSVFLHLPTIPETRRQTERKFWPAVRADYPRILGGVLDAIVGGLRELPSVNLTDLPRMADYAEWGEPVWSTIR